MGQTDKQSTPKYMCLKANTQYELAQSIDAALQDAELMVQKDHGEACLHIWLEQILDAFNEEFALNQPVEGIKNLEELQVAVLRLYDTCARFYQASNGESGSIEAFQMLMVLIMERSFVNTMDMMHARDIWRFDIQRAMQDAQGVMVNAIRECHF